MIVMIVTWVIMIRTFSSETMMMKIMMITMLVMKTLISMVMVRMVRMMLQLHLILVGSLDCDHIYMHICCMTSTVPQCFVLQRSEPFFVLQSHFSDDGLDFGEYDQNLFLIHIRCSIQTHHHLRTHNYYLHHHHHHIFEQFFISVIITHSRT